MAATTATTLAAVTKLVPLLERLSLLRITPAALDRVVRTVEMANTLDEVVVEDSGSRTSKIEPMISPTEADCVYLRDDQPAPTDRVEAMKNAAKVVEDYFVTPSEHKHYTKL